MALGFGATGTGISTDQRSEFRASPPDLGAYEYNVVASKLLPTTPTATLTGSPLPFAMVFDSQGDLFVSNAYHNTVNEYAPGATTPTAVLSGGLNFAGAMAFDSHGDLFVANYDGSTVSEFTPGATTPTATLTGVDEATALAFDSSGNLFASNLNGTVSKFAPVPRRFRPSSTPTLEKSSRWPSIMTEIYMRASAALTSWTGPLLVFTRSTNLDPRHHPRGRAHRNGGAVRAGL